jgi:hypothetical protein
MFELKKSEHIPGAYELVNGNVHYGTSLPLTDEEFLHLIESVATVVRAEIEWRKRPRIQQSPDGEGGA